MAAFSKRHYETLAAILRRTKPETVGSPVNAISHKALAQWDKMVSMFVFEFEHDNPRFNREKFLAACGWK